MLQLDLSFFSNITWWQWLIVVLVVITIVSTAIKMYDSWKERKEEDWED